MKNSVLVNTYLNVDNKIRTAHCLPGSIYNISYRLMRAHMIYPITLSINIKITPNET